MAASVVSTMADSPVVKAAGAIGPGGAVGWFQHRRLRRH